MFGFQYTFLSIYAFFIVTALLYLPMMYSLYKLRHLKSIKETQPQKYLLWQTVTLLITKLVLIPIVIFYFYYVEGEYDSFGELFSDLWYFVKLDSFTTPLAMQVTYLGCNKKNLEMALSCFKRKIKTGAGLEPVPTESTISVRQINVVKMT
ncbi:hypothetical protein CAEBREN_16144 [Caenorhabditis brenneri]|uniref:Serpentine receptor class gamma n=1 Tax=Caenorhabditis brenneri TaxID=135651 RepID=G0MJF6_CAEBE|nr:hypothetical protein CAEBREN_16144 [Caenorhabditis brenneri]